MLAAERRDFLLARLEQDGKVVAKDVATELGISEDSIRRDLRELASAGLCQRVYGGALPVSPAIADHTVRTGIEVSGKHRVAAAAAALIRPGSTAILDGGTTALAVARALPAGLRATVITHSPVVAAALGDHPQVDVIVIGGRLFKHSMVTCGAAAVEAVNGIHADVFLLGVTGVHPDAGLTTGDSDEAAMKRTLARHAADTYVLASSEKIGTASQFTVLPLADIAGLVTDAPADHPIVQRLHALDVPIVDAPDGSAWSPGGVPSPD
ncbi:DeoR/GlpR family DNA-binding transcription regulator [Jiangella alkaliphila]|uniref:Lactose phosphotransferase system repressor n=1 Tax=Jiangella alkaliphila TaxID=419479 RepID=A0A1H2LAW8_9ACTN|nr:DeoR/GlpR family DNA-binding transcription regulator [Jiangella alkaliphila]SDU78069.1 DNA-binding transcriptional regulator of sugar metabolism, DeoR/GlpR family [Jiangella alkaliphila]